MDWDWDVSTESLSVMVEICEQFVAEGTLPQKGRWQGCMNKYGEEMVNKISEDLRSKAEVGLKALENILNRKQGKCFKGGARG